MADTLRVTLVQHCTQMLLHHHFINPLQNAIKYLNNSKWHCLCHWAEKRKVSGINLCSLVPGQLNGVDLLSCWQMESSPAPLQTGGHFGGKERGTCYCTALGFSCNKLSGTGLAKPAFFYSNAGDSHPKGEQQQVTLSWRTGIIKSSWPNIFCSLIKGFTPCTTCRAAGNKQFSNVWNLPLNPQLRAHSPWRIGTSRGQSVFLPAACCSGEGRIVIQECPPSFLPPENDCSPASCNTQFLYSQENHPLGWWKKKYISLIGYREMDKVGPQTPCEEKYELINPLACFLEPASHWRGWDLWGQAEEGIAPWHLNSDWCLCGGFTMLGS